MTGEFEYQFPWVLVLLGLLPLYALLAGRSGRLSALVISSAELVRSAGGKARSAAGRLLLSLRLLVLALTIIALAGPRLADYHVENENPGIDIMLVLDLSWSMSAVDMGRPGQNLTRFACAAGVMKDFNYQSLHDAVAPFMVIYRYWPIGFSHLIVQANSTDYTSLLDKMGHIWRQRVFVGAFEHSYLTDEIDSLYKTEVIMSRIINSFTIMAIVISCLGLFGLAAFNAEQRTKEIGIRKVMGASVAGIVQLLSMDFLKLICYSFLLGAPLAWWIMNKWLNVFAYHISIPWWTYGIAGGATIIAGMTVVSLQAAKAAVVNPVKSLRAV